MSVPGLAVAAAAAAELVGGEPTKEEVVVAKAAAAGAQPEVAYSSPASTWAWVSRCHWHQVGEVGGVPRTPSLRRGKEGEPHPGTGRVAFPNMEVEHLSPKMTQLLATHHCRTPRRMVAGNVTETA